MYESMQARIHGLYEKTRHRNYRIEGEEYSAMRVIRVMETIFNNPRYQNDAENVNNGNCRDRKCRNSNNHITEKEKVS